MNSIFKYSLPNFELNESELNYLKKVEPIKFNLPIDGTFKEIVAKNTLKGEMS